MINRTGEREQVKLKASGGDDEKDSAREMASSRIDPSDTDEEDMEENPARMERKGRPEVQGRGKDSADGSIVGSGRGGEPSHRNTMGHESSAGKEPKAGCTMGDRDGVSGGSGFEAGGNLKKEHGRVKNQP